MVLNQRSGASFVLGQAILIPANADLPLGRTANTHTLLTEATLLTVLKPG